MKLQPGILKGLVLILLFGCTEEKEPETSSENLQLISVSVGPENISFSSLTEDLPLNLPVVIRFAQSLESQSISDQIELKSLDGESEEITLSLIDNDKTISVQPTDQLKEYQTYTLHIQEGIRGKNGQRFPGITLYFKTLRLPLELLHVEIAGNEATENQMLNNIPLDPELKLSFSSKTDPSDLHSSIQFSYGATSFDFELISVNDTLFEITPLLDLPYYREITFTVSNSLTDMDGRAFDGYETTFFTRLDSTYKFSEIPDNELLTLIQSQTFNYFWDFGHPVSGLSRERNTSGDVVASGGSGFGLMTIPVGIERAFITREEGIGRVSTMVDFLSGADRFHGAWSHWLDGSTGKVIPFSAKDDGGDLVETSYLAMGLITVREYLNEGIPTESQLIEDINTLLDSIEWDWYTQNENSLTWHWSPNYGFEKNHKIRGWNEALITYIIAASSATHGIAKEVYEQGWAAGSNMLNGNDYYSIMLPLGPPYGGPLFLEQYTFLGLDPRNLSDQFANYWQQVVNHSLINRGYCIDNPKNYIGYSEDCWGLTASDGNRGYSAHSPTNDRGVISPTAAVSSIAFTPTESMDAIHHFYYLLGDRLWGPYGFYDAFNVTENWYATSNIAIDQGPMILMIENYRTGLLWNLFMSAPEIQQALSDLGFTY